MAYTIDLEGLPEPVAKAIAVTVLSLKNQYRIANEERHALKPPEDLPCWPGSAIGELHRIELYDER